MALSGEERDVRLYLDRDGRAPFSDWLRALPDIKGRARIRERINRVRLGNIGDCEPVGEGVYELRIHSGPGYRVYFGQEGRTVVILLCGGSKRTQKADIKIARKLWLDYKER